MLVCRELRQARKKTEDEQAAYRSEYEKVKTHVKVSRARPKAGTGQQHLSAMLAMLTRRQQQLSAYGVWWCGVTVAFVWCRPTHHRG